MPGIRIGLYRPAEKTAVAKSKGRQIPSSSDGLLGADGETNLEAEPPWEKVSAQALPGLVVVDPSDEMLAFSQICNKYGENLRFAADNSMIMRAVAGNKTDNSPLAWAFLLLLTRNRQFGLSFPDLKVALGADAQSIFFLTKAMSDRGLAIKFKKVGARSTTNWVVARQFADDCPYIPQGTLNDARKDANGDDDDGLRDDERTEAGDAHETGNDDDDDDVENVHVKGDPDEPSLVEMPAHAVRQLMRRHERGLTDDEQEEDNSSDAVSGTVRHGDTREATPENVEEHEQDEEKISAEDSTTGRIPLDMTTLRGILSFPPIEDNGTAQYLLLDKELLRWRVLKILIASKNHATVRHDFVRRVGIYTPSKTQRKLFQQQVRSMISENLVQQCQLRRPLIHRADHVEVCYRMTPEGEEYFARSSASSQQKDVRRQRESSIRQLALSESSIVFETTFERQVLEAVAQSGAQGSTIEELRLQYHGSKDRSRDLNHILLAMKHKDGRSNVPQYEDMMLFSALEQTSRVRSARFWMRPYIPERGFNAAMRAFNRIALSSRVQLDDESVADCAKSWQSAVSKTFKANNIRPTTKKRGRPRKSESAPMTASSAQILVSKRAAEGEGMPSLTDIHHSVEEKNEPAKPKGRPRKHFTEKALKTAARYQKKKMLAAREAEENGDRVSPPRKGGKRRRNSASQPENEAAASSIVQMQEELSSNMQADAPDAPTTKADVFQPIDPALRQIDRRGPTTSTEFQHDTSSFTLTAGDAWTQQNSQSLSEGSAQQPALLPARKLGKASRLNLTVQLKYDAVLGYMERVRLIEISRMERSYLAYVRKTFPTQDIAPYEMDRKVRQKILNLLQKAGIVRLTSTQGPKARGLHDARKQMTIVSLSVVPIAEVIEYARTIAEREDDYSRLNISATDEHAVLHHSEVDAPDSFFGPRLQADLEAQSLTQLLEDPKYRSQLMHSAAVRNSFTRRIPGLAARAQYFHAVCLDIIRNEPSSKYVSSDATFDVTWWTEESSLNSFLLLAECPPSEDVLQVAQNPIVRSMQLQNLGADLKTTLQLNDRPSTAHHSIRPLLDILQALALAEPIDAPHGSRVPCYRFVRHAPAFAWSANGQQLYQSDVDIDLFKTGGCHELWSCISRKGASSTTVSRNALLPNASDELVAMLARPSSWRKLYRMHSPQVAFFLKAKELGIDPASVVDDHDLLAKLSHAGLAPIEFVQKFYERRFNVSVKTRVHSQLQTRPQRASTQMQRKGEACTQIDESVAGPLTKRQMKRVQRQARQARDERFKEYEDLLASHVANLGLTLEELDVLKAGLKPLGAGYANGDGTMNRSLLDTKLLTVENCLREGNLDFFKDTVIGPRHKIKKSSKTSHPIRESAVIKGDSGRLQGVAGRSVLSGRKFPRKSRQGIHDWTPAKSELLRDCAVILRARDKYRSPGIPAPRRQWSALLALFPEASHLAALTNQFDKLKNVVGEELYLDQLEVEWTRLWEQYRGTDYLPDPDFSSPEVDLHYHVAFLRKNIDKHQVENLVFRGTGTSLPLLPSRLIRKIDYDIPSEVQPFINFSALSRNTVGDAVSELRSVLLARHSFTVDAISQRSTGFLENAPQSSLRHRELVKGVIKMTEAIDDEHYNATVAEAFCKANADEKSLSHAIEELKAAGILKQKSNEGRQLPDRNLIYSSERNDFFTVTDLEAIHPMIIAAEASRLLGSKQKDRQRRNRQPENRPPTFIADGLETDEETAACVCLISNRLVDVTIDMSAFESLKRRSRLNGKKVADVDLEAPVRIHNCDKASSKTLVSSSEKWLVRLATAALANVSLDTSDPLEAWSKRSENIENLVQRWNEDCSKMFHLSGQSDKSDLGPRLQQALNGAAADGLGGNQLLDLCQSTDGSVVDYQSLEGIINVMMTGFKPVLVFWTGVDRSRLVAAPYARHWRIKAGESNEELIAPHPWFDWSGVLAREDVWQASIRLVLYAAITQPGVTLAAVVTAMQVGALDRLDVFDVVQHLVAQHLIDVEWTQNCAVRNQAALFCAANDGELALVFHKSS